jgi:hypothetical protein
MMISFRKAGATTPALSRDKETGLSKMQASVIEMSLSGRQVPDGEMKNYFMTDPSRCHCTSSGADSADFSSGAFLFLLPTQQVFAAFPTVAGSASCRRPATTPRKPVPARPAADLSELAR